MLLSRELVLFLWGWEGSKLSLFQIYYVYGLGEKLFITYFLNSPFETLHVCYKCAEKEYVPFQTGKIIFDKITVLSNLSPANQSPRNRFAS